MSNNLRVTLTVQPQLTSGSKEPSVPFSFFTQYAQKVMAELVFTGAVTDEQIPSGHITAPQALIVEVYDGAIDFGFDISGSAGTGKLPVSRSGNPIPDAPGYIIWYNPTPSAKKIYATTTGPARANIWLFQ